MIPIPAIIIIALGVLICTYLIISLYKAFNVAIEALEQNENKTNLVEMEVNKMTNEEAKEIIIKERDSLKANPMVEVEDCLYEAFDMAIKALEQRPARWNRFTDNYKECSRCGKLIKYYYNYKYCPGCGREMEEVKADENNR